jgi:predicted nucleotidyltransferase
VRAKRPQIDRLLEARGAGNPRVFGSVARGTADDRSDVDILVDFREPAPEGFAYFGALDQLEQDLGRLLGTSVHVSVVDRTSPAAQKILREAVPL